MRYIVWMDWIGHLSLCSDWVIMLCWRHSGLSVRSPVLGSNTNNYETFPMVTWEFKTFKRSANNALQNQPGMLMTTYVSGFVGSKYRFPRTERACLSFACKLFFGGWDRAIRYYGTAWVSQYDRWVSHITVCMGITVWASQYGSMVYWTKAKTNQSSL